MKNVPKEIGTIEESIRRLLNNEPYSKTRAFKPLSQENLETLKLFDRYNNLREVTSSSRRNYLFYLKSFVLNVNKSFKDITKEDIENYILFLNKRALATKNLSKVIIKRFFQWFYGFNKDKYPEIVDWIQTGIKNSKRTLPENLLTHEEILKLAQSTDNLRDQAILFVLTESGIRVSELTNLKIKDFEPLNDGTALIKVSGKTGERKILLINSVNPLILWLNTHPYRNEPEAPLFVNLSRNRYGERITRGSVEYMVQKVAKISKINKRVYPHLFRHVSATRDSKDFSDALMRLKYGWSSNFMPQLYSHLTIKDLISKEKERAGINEGEAEPEDKVLKPIICPKCGESNMPSNKFCGRCATPLGEQNIQRLVIENVVQTVIENLFDKRPELQDLARTEIMNNPELKEKLSKLNHPEIQRLLAIQKKVIN